jgi:hypothetical protein
MSESENDEPAKHEVDTHRHSKGEQLVRDVFAPVRSRQLKRDRPLHGYNFSPPSTPSGNLTILERDQLRTETWGCIQEDEYSDDDISSFTRRCLKQQTFTDKKMILNKLVEVTDSDWILLASYLSPCRKTPLQPGDFPITLPHLTESKKSSKPPCVHACRCIACAGMKAQPCSAPCLVCGASISYSVCVKENHARSPLPTICFKCKCAFQSESFSM